jgi:hypothetical protein
MIVVSGGGGTAAETKPNNKITAAFGSMLDMVKH